MNDNREQLENKLYEKADLELKTFFNDIEKLPPKELINKAYEVITKQDLLMSLEAPDFLSDSQLSVLCQLEQPLTSLYFDWMEHDDSRMQEIRDSMSDYTDTRLKEKAMEYFVNPQNPRYDKTISYARDYDELHLYRANKEIDLACLHFFEAGISNANQNHQTKAFVTEWTEKYGRERCQYVLGYAVQKADYDGRYSKEAKRHSREFTYENQHRDFTTNAHPCLVDCAYRLMMDMEKGKTKQEKER